MHVDTRDSIFQQDIFQFYDNKRPFLGIAVEKNYLNEILNRRWFINSFGRDIYQKVKNERIICGGTVIGTADKFLLLANKIWDKVKLNPFNKRKNDQVVLNYLIYIEKIFDDCLKKSENKDGYIVINWLY